MKAVEFSVAASHDLLRLRAGLDGRAPRAAGEAVDILITAAQSLAESPERGQWVSTGLRELVVPFGSAGYVLQYRVGPLRVIIARIFHTLEDR
jgi:plasmid stabilization system protein ParE